ncbi:MAG: Na+/proline symporter [uncultured bacterium]|nr:MAG: Na+/proline symporter [uncultured bacterium]
MRKVKASECKGKITFFGDIDSVFYGFGAIRKQALHFPGRPEIELIASELHPLFVIHRFACLYTEQNLVGLFIALIKIMTVVSCHQRESMVLREFDQSTIDRLLLRKAILHNFDEEIPLAKDFPVLFSGSKRFFGISPEQMCRDFPMETGAHTDQSLAVLGQHLLVDPGPIVKSVQKTGGRQSHEVLISLHVPGKDDDMICRLRASMARLVKTAFRRDVQFAADDRFDPVLISMFIEIDRSIEIAMIGHRNSGHLIFFCFPKKVVETDRAIEETVLGVKVKMNKIRVCHRRCP